MKMEPKHLKVGGQSLLPKEMTGFVQQVCHFIDTSCVYCAWCAAVLILYLLIVAATSDFGMSVWILLHAADNRWWHNSFTLICYILIKKLLLHVYLFFCKESVISSDSLFLRFLNLQSSIAVWVYLCESHSLSVYIFSSFYWPQFCLSCSPRLPSVV